jgi:hypothetical protein
VNSVSTFLQWDTCQALKEKGLWRRLGENMDQYGNMRPEKGDSVYYHRDYVSKWISNGWVEKDDFYKRYVLTDEGRRIIETFYTD